MKRREITPRIVSSRSDRLVMSQKVRVRVRVKRIHGSIGQRSRISLLWIPIARNIRSFNSVEVGELVSR